ncbi:MAG: hypothetical protein RLZZ46_1261, partial [Bacteroidota bacterium]
MLSKFTAILALTGLMTVFCGDALADERRTS